MRAKIFLLLPFALLLLASPALTLPSASLQEGEEATILQKENFVQTSSSSRKPHHFHLDIEEDEHGYWIKKQPTNTTYRGDWMGKASKHLWNRTLMEMTLPGTHDSGAYWLGKFVEPGALPNIPREMIDLAVKLNVRVDKIVALWSLAQDRDFYEQDIRCGWNGTDWVAFHGLAGPPLPSLLSQLAKFISEEKTEILLLEMSHFDNNPTEKDVEILAGMVSSHLGEWLVSPDSNLEWTYGEMMQKNKRVIVTMESGWGNVFFNGSTIFNTYANSATLANMELFNNDQVSVFATHSWGEGPLFKISWTLTTQVDTVTHCLLPHHPRSLRNLATTANKAMPMWTEGVRNHYPRLGNVFIMDFFADVDPVNVTQSAYLFEN